MGFISGLNIIIQLGCDCRTFNRLNGICPKRLIEPAVIKIFRRGRAYNQAVVIKIADRSDTLIFFFRQHFLQRRYGLMIVEKRIKNEYQACGSQQKDGSQDKKTFQEFLIHAVLLSDGHVLKIEIYKGAHSGQRDDGPGKQEGQSHALSRKKASI